MFTNFYILLEDSMKRSTNFDEIVEKDLIDLLRKKCPCTGPYFPAFVLNTKEIRSISLFNLNMWKWGPGKVQISPNGDTFHTGIVALIIVENMMI